MSQMNYTSAIFLVNDAVRAVRVSYDADSEGKGIRPFTTFKSLDPRLEVGQYAVIPTDTRHKMTVVRIEEIADANSIDPASPTQLMWIIDPVSTEAYDKIRAQEVTAIERIKSAERTAARKELTDKLLADNPDIAALGDLNAPPALAAPLSQP